jgi:transglutaminase-like putative cysteine protease
MLYDISLRISYVYDHPADSSRHIVRLSPADLPGEQRQVAGTLTIDPKPAEQRTHSDFFGNQSVELAYFDAHEKIKISVHSRVERFELNQEFAAAPSLGQLKNGIAAHKSLAPLAPHHFVGPTSRVPIEPATTEYARKLIAEHHSVLEIIVAIGERLHREFRYDPEATTVETPMLEAFRGGRGVCQDFSHIMIACLRGIGIPAGYVSGFLRTTPPPGKKRLEGADAMHAWVRAWCGEKIGWVEYDPTNATFAGSDHVVIARGRDYADVAPIKGILRSHGKHTSTQIVDVVPVDQ